MEPISSKTGTERIFCQCFTFNFPFLCDINLLMMPLCFITLFYLSQISYSAIFHAYLLFAGKTMRSMSIEWISSRTDIRLHYFFCPCAKPEKINWGGRLCTVDLLIKVACLVKKAKNIFNLQWSWSKLVSTRRSTILSPSLH